MEKTKKKNASSNDPDGRSKPVTNEQEKLRKKVTLLMKKQKLQQVRQIVKGQDNSKPWGQDAHVKVRVVYKGFKWKSPGSLLLLLINHYRIFSVCCYLLIMITITVILSACRYLLIIILFFICLFFDWYLFYMFLYHLCLRAIS